MCPLLAAAAVKVMLLVVQAVPTPGMALIMVPKLPPVLLYIVGWKLPFCPVPCEARRKAKV